MPHDLQQYIILWGPGVLILFVFAWGCMRLAQRWIDRSTEVKKGQIETRAAK